MSIGRTFDSYIGRKVHHICDIAYRNWGITPYSISSSTVLVTILLLWFYTLANYSGLLVILILSCGTFFGFSVAEMLNEHHKQFLQCKLIEESIISSYVYPLRRMILFFIRTGFLIFFIDMFIRGVSLTNVLFVCANICLTIHLHSLEYLQQWKNLRMYRITC
jgi:hypothetical protein